MDEQDKIRKTGFGKIGDLQSEWVGARDAIASKQGITMKKEAQLQIDLAFEKGYPGQRASGFPMPEGPGAGGKSILFLEVN